MISDTVHLGSDRGGGEHLGGVVYMTEKRDGVWSWGRACGLVVWQGCELGRETRKVG